MTPAHRTLYSVALYAALHFLLMWTHRRERNGRRLHTMLAAALMN